MNDFSLKDDDLSALEAQLLGQSPKLDPVGQQLLIYRCAFDVGKRAGTRSLRGWQAGTVAALLMLGLMQFPWNRPGVIPEGPALTTSAKKEETSLGVHGNEQGNQKTPGFALESLKNQEDKDEAFEREWQRYARLEPREKAHTLIQFSLRESLDH